MLNRGRRCVVGGVVAALAGMSIACGGNGGTLTELQRVKSGDLNVVLLSAHDTLRHGKDAFVIEFRSASGALVDVGAVSGSTTMPMPGMAPMLGGLDVAKTDVAGRYTASSTFSMAGSWRTTIQWDGAAGRGSVTFASAVQ